MAYELREFPDDESYSDTSKYAMSMVISALDGSKISEEDKNDLERKLDTSFDESTPDETDEFSSEDNVGELKGEKMENMEESIVIGKQTALRLLKEVCSCNNDDSENLLFDIDEELMFDTQDCGADDNLLFDTNKNDKKQINTITYRF